MGAASARVWNASEVGDGVPLREVTGEHTVSVAPKPVPCMRLFTERVLVDHGWGRDCDYEEIEAPLITLSFQYPGARLRCSDPQDRFFSSAGGGMTALARNVSAEAEAQRILERYGATPLECMPDYGVAPDVEADYLVRVDGDQHSYCAFTSYAVPHLRELGWRVEIDEQYGYQVVDREVPWYAVVEADEDKPDWFNLELGVEYDGRRINMLPVLLDLLDNARGQKTLASLERASTRFFALPVDDRRYLPIPPERMKWLLRVMIELYEGEGGRDMGHLAFPGQGAAALTRLDEIFPSEQLCWEGESEEVRRRGRRLARPPEKPVEPPAGLQATLRPYQEHGLAWLQHMRDNDVGGVLADDMGLGKTLQTIAHVVTEKAAGRLDRPALVVAPTSLVFNWAREIDKFAPHLRVVSMQGPRRHAHWGDVAGADVVLTSYPLLVRDEERWAEHAFHLLILDEAQTVKNVRSQAHRAVRGIEADHKLCLTGTPLENNLGELWALFDFLNPGLLGDEPRFRAWYRHPIERQGDEERLVALQQLVSPYILRRLKRDVAKDLPPKTEVDVPVELTGKQRELYESIRVAAHAQVRRIIKKKGFVASTVSILDALMKLRQVCCDPRLVNMDAARFVRESAKYAHLMELVGAQLAQGHRCLIFSQFTSMLALIARGLDERGIGHVALTGSTRHRHRIVDAFESGEADVFLISLKAGGTGLTLTSADTVIHYDPWWNPAAQAQATDRAYRIGQTKPVFVHNLYVSGSVEERMLQLQQRKRALANAILGHGAGPAALTEDDVDELFAPLDD